MKGHLSAVTISVFVLLPCFLFGSFQAALSTRMLIPGQQVLFGRETYLQYGFENSIFALRLINDSYDQFLYGSDVRWGLMGLVVLPYGDFKLSCGAGAGLSEAFQTGQRLSLDFYVKARYGWLYIEADALFFNGGLFDQCAAGLEWEIPLGGGQTLAPFIALGCVLNTDYSRLRYVFSLNGGIIYGF